MQKYGFIILGFVSVSFCYLIFLSADIVLRSNWQMPNTTDQLESQYRIVLITKDMETPFWNKVGYGAIKQAKNDGVSIEVWGSYNNNQQEFLKKLELAIHSKMDGIIIQGLDTAEFKDLTKIKASFYGIPIITIANDVPMADSLRKTYVGSDQYKAGQKIAKELLSEMGTTGNVILIYDSEQEYYQKQRLAGIQEILKDYPNIQTVDAQTSVARDQITATTREVLNQMPHVDAFIAISANIVGPMVQEIGQRSQVEPYHIYSFDDGPESLSLLIEGKIDSVIEQNPEKMGEMSVTLLVEWLKGETVPLNRHGYFTDTQILKAKNGNE